METISPAIASWLACSTLSATSSSAAPNRTARSRASFGTRWLLSSPAAPARPARPRGTRLHRRRRSPRVFPSSRRAAEGCRRSFRRTCGRRSSARTTRRRLPRRSWPSSRAPTRGANARPSLVNGPRSSSTRVGLQNGWRDSTATCATLIESRRRGSSMSANPPAEDVPELEIGLEDENTDERCVREHAESELREEDRERGPAAGERPADDPDDQRHADRGEQRATHCAEDLVNVHPDQAPGYREGE